MPYVGLVVGAAVAAGVGLAMRRLRSGAVKAGGDVRGTAVVEDGAGLAAAAVAVVPFVGLRPDRGGRLAAAAPAPPRRREVPRPARAAMTGPGGEGAGKKLILAVVDGLGPALLDRAITAGRAPTMARLAAAGERRDDCVSTFPSLTPVCLAALITGQHPAGSHIPGMSWYHRDERRLVEYGSSFAATLAEGTRQMVDDVLVNMNLVHLSPQPTVFEALDDAGLVTAGVNTYVCRGRTRHPITRPVARRLARSVGIVDAVYGPRRYFLGDLFFSDRTGAPHNFGGGIDRHAGAVGRWLVTRDGFDFLFFYMYETDAAQHRAGDVLGAVEGADNGLGLMVEAAGGLDHFLDRYAVIVVADHSQSAVLADRRCRRSARGLDTLPLEPPLGSRPTASSP